MKFEEKTVYLADISFVLIGTIIYLCMRILIYDWRTYPCQIQSFSHIYGQRAQVSGALIIDGYILCFECKELDFSYMVFH